MVDADLGASSDGAVVVEERPREVDGADAVEGDDERVLLPVVRVGSEGNDGAEGTVAHVGLAITVGVEVPVRGAGGDSVADGEPSLAAGDDLLFADLAVDLTEPVGEAEVEATQDCRSRSGTATTDTRISSPTRPDRTPTIVSLLRSIRTS